MDLPVSLERAEAKGWWNSSDRALIARCKATLSASTGWQKKGEALAEHLCDFINAGKQSPEECDPYVQKLWLIFYLIVTCVPPHHMWQDALLHCLAILRAKKEPLPSSAVWGFNPDNPTLWSQLPEIGWVEREMLDRGITLLFLVACFYCLACPLIHTPCV